MTPTRLTTLVLLAVAGLACQRQQSEPVKPVEKPARAIIKYADWEVETPIDVTCGILESFLGSYVKTVVAEDRPFLDSLGVLLGDLRPANKGFTPDVRMSVEVLFTSGKKTLLCLSNLALEMDGKEMAFDKRLLKLLEGRTRRKE